MAMSGGKYVILLVAEHGLYPLKLDAKQGWHDRIYMTPKRSYSCLSFNTPDGDDTPWNQSGGTGATLSAGMKPSLAVKGADPSKLGRWTWVQIEGKVGESTIFVLAYRPCKNTAGISTVWNQHV